MVDGSDVRPVFEFTRGPRLRDGEVNRRGVFGRGASDWQSAEGNGEGKRC